MATDNVSPESRSNIVDVNDFNTTKTVESQAASHSNHSLETLDLKKEEEKDEARVDDIVGSKLEENAGDNTIVAQNVQSLESSSEPETHPPISAQVERIEPSFSTETVSDITTTELKVGAHKIDERHNETIEDEEAKTDMVAGLEQDASREIVVNDERESVSYTPYESDVSEISDISKIATEVNATCETIEVPIEVKISEFQAPTVNKVQHMELTDSVADELDADESPKDKPNPPDADESLLVVEKLQNDQLIEKLGNSGEEIMVHNVECPASKAELPPLETTLSLSQTEPTLPKFGIPPAESEVLMPEKEPFVSEIEVLPLEVEPTLPEARVPSLETEQTVSQVEVRPSETEVPLSETTESETVDSPAEPKSFLPEVDICSIESEPPSVVEVDPLEIELPVSETEFPQSKVDSTLGEVAVSLSETTETLPPKEEVPLSQTKSHLPESEVLPSQTEPTLPKVDVTSDTETLARQDEVVTLSEGEPLPSETEIPQVETEARKEEEQKVLEGEPFASETEIPQLETEAGKKKHPNVSEGEPFSVETEIPQVETEARKEPNVPEGDRLPSETEIPQLEIEVRNEKPNDPQETFTEGEEKVVELSIKLDTLQDAPISDITKDGESCTDIPVQHLDLAKKDEMVKEVPDSSVDKSDTVTNEAMEKANANGVIVSTNQEDQPTKVAPKIGTTIDLEGGSGIENTTLNLHTEPVAKKSLHDLLKVEGVSEVAKEVIEELKIEGNADINPLFVTEQSLGTDTSLVAVAGNELSNSKSHTCECAEVVKEMVNDDLSSPVGPSTDVDKSEELIDNNFADNLEKSVLPNEQTSKVEEETAPEENIEKTVDQNKGGEGNVEKEKTDGMVESGDLNSANATKIEAVDEPPKQEVTIKTVHRQSNLMSKLRQSIVKVKKIITGKSPSTKSPSSKAEVNVTK